MGPWSVQGPNCVAAVIGSIPCAIALRTGYRGSCGGDGAPADFDTDDVTELPPNPPTQHEKPEVGSFCEVRDPPAWLVQVTVGLPPQAQSKHPAMRPTGKNRMAIALSVVPIHIRDLR
jgi:hypothetical protein